MDEKVYDSSVSASADYFDCFSCDFNIDRISCRQLGNETIFAACIWKRGGVYSMEADAGLSHF